MFLMRPVSLCVCVFFSSVIQTEKLPIFNLEQTQLTRKQTIVPPHQGIDWYQATNEICIACLKLDLLFFLIFFVLFEYCTDDCC